MPGSKSRKKSRHVAFEGSKVHHKFESFTETSEIRVIPDDDLEVIEERLFEHHARIQAFFEQETAGVLPTDKMWTGGQDTAPALLGSLPTQHAATPPVPVRRPVSIAKASGIRIECGACFSDIPPGLCFCPRCGGSPTYATEPRQQALLIEGFRDEATRARFESWVSRAHPNMDKGEVFASLERTPSVLPIKATVSQAHMTEQWLRDAGVEASVLRPSEAKVPWVREALFPVWANPVLRFILIGVSLGVLALGVSSSGLWLLPGLLAVLVFVLVKVKAMNRRPGIAPDRLLSSMGGLDQKTVSVLRKLLVELRDEELHHCMTICILEYQAVGTYLHGLAPSLGGLMDESQAILERLMGQLTTAGLQYLSLEGYLAGVEHGRLKASIESNEAQLAQETDATRRARHLKLIEQIQAQLDAVERIESDRSALKGQIMHLITTVEAFRARMLAVTVGGELGSGESLDEAIRELDQEMEVLEETVSEIQAL